MRVKVPAGQASPVAVVVAVINTSSKKLFLLCLSIYLVDIQAAVLPEDRADILFHSFDGGGVEITGPSILVRKKFGDKVSATINHYVDNVSSASIDVLTTASPYSESRDENSVGIDYLHDKTIMSVSMTESVESDFDASTFSVNFSQDMFGDLTTVNMGFSRGDNIIGQNGNSSFNEQATTRNYRLSVSQVVTKNLIMALAFETVSDEGFLNNPYRSVRYLATPTQYLFQAEVYPGTRSSNALALRTRYYLQRRAAIHGGYRIYSDSWGIVANTVELGYTLPYRTNWIFEASFRYYDQSNADFYSDLFPFQDAQNFLARDKELSSFNSQTIGFGLSYEIDNQNWRSFKRGSLNFNYDFIQFDYDDFRDLTQPGSVGNEPLYSFNAGVIRAFASLWF
jgi:hypothetical protein